MEVGRMEDVSGYELVNWQLMDSLVGDSYTERKVAEDLAGRLHSSLYMSIISAPVN